MNNKIMLNLLFIISIFILLGIASINILYFLNYDKTNLQSINVIESDCNGMDLINTSYCLQKELKIFYKYNLSQVDEKYNLSKLKLYGGVCWQWSEYYKERLINLGAEYIESNKIHIKKDSSDTAKFYITLQTIPVDYEYNHEYAVVSNNISFCKLDELNVDCWSWTNENK
jgi:hypothetical protein